MKRVHGFVLAALAGVATGLLWQPAVVTTTGAEDDIWSVPEPSELARYDAADLATVRKQVQWGGESSDQQDTAKQEQSWRLAGISRDPDPVALIQMTKSKQLLRLAAGAELPDGSRVERIENDRVTVINGDCRRTLQLYRPDQPASSAVCEGVADE
ncbi:MAG TPA: hypothetical protein VFY12_10220 [Arenimonas sp.]|nr:hypothetical protein [Arenimonas sp.]